MKMKVIVKKHFVVDGANLTIMSLVSITAVKR
jgi:hypothetical protein